MTRPWLDANGNTFPYRKLIHAASLKARIGWQSLRTDEFVDEGPYCVTGTDFQNGRVNWSTAYHVSTERYEMDRNIQLNEGDLLVTKDGTIGKVAVVHGLDAPATLNSGVFVVRPKTRELSTDFLGWVVRSKVFDDFVAFNFSGSTINHLYQNVFETFRFPFPDLPTQRAIADFLDRETARIDTLIEKKQRLVELLGEKVKAKITQTVRGAREASRKRLRHVSSLNPSTKEIRIAKSEMVTFCAMDSIQDGIGGLDPSISRQLSDVISGSYNYFAEGDVLLAKVTPCFENGKKALAKNLQNGIGFATSEVFVIRPDKEKLSAEYLIYLLSSEEFQYAGRASMTGAGGLKRISEKSIMDFPLLVENLNEQNSIVSEIDKFVSTSTKISSAANKSIDRLKEYRSALITSAVTGQIDVTKWTNAETTGRQLDAIEEEFGA